MKNVGERPEDEDDEDDCCGTFCLRFIHEKIIISKEKEKKEKRKKEMLREESARNETGNNLGEAKVQGSPLFPDQPFGFLPCFLFRGGSLLPSVHPKKQPSPQSHAPLCPCVPTDGGDNSVHTHLVPASNSGNIAFKRQRPQTTSFSGCGCDGAQCTFLTCTCPHRSQAQKVKGVVQALALAGSGRLGRDSPASILVANALVFDYFVDTLLVGRVATPPLYMSLYDDKYAITSAGGEPPAVTKLHYCTRVIGSAGPHKTVGFMAEAECKIALWDPSKSPYPQEHFTISASTVDKFVCNARWLVGYNGRAHAIKVWSLKDKLEKAVLRCTENIVSMQVVECPSGDVLRVVMSKSSLSASSVVTVADYSLPGIESGPTQPPLVKDIGDALGGEAGSEPFYSLHIMEGGKYIIVSRTSDFAVLFDAASLNVVGKVERLRSVVPVGGCSFAALDTGVARLYRADSDGLKMVKEVLNVGDCAGSGGVLFIKRVFSNMIEAFSSESGESLWTIAPDVSKDFRGGQYISSFPV